METEVESRSVETMNLTERLKVRLQIEQAQRYPNCSGIALLKAKLAILEAGGQALLPCLKRADGSTVFAMRFKTPYGLAWKLPDGAWVSDKPGTLKRRGYHAALVLRNAWASLKDGQVEIYPVAVNYLERGHE